MDGQPRHDQQGTPASENPNVFDDEFAIDNDPLEPEFSVADGFRPDQSRQSSTFIDSPTLERMSIEEPISGIALGETKSRPHIPSRSSTSKGHPNQDPLAVQYEGVNAPLPGPIPSIYSHGTTTPAVVRHASLASTSSFATTARSHSTLPSGPSHPYGMYPQDTGMARSVSGATSSTIRAPSRTQSGHHRPAHPYALYPQNVLEDSEETTGPAPQLIPVGFPGMSTGYHRQIGPDGEDQGLMGLDGHTEQLPPYSKYPEQGPASPVVPMTQPVTPQESIALGNLGSPDSQTTLIRPNNGHGADQLNRSPSLPLSEPPSFSSSEKSWSEKTWKEKRKTRFFGGKIPLWAIVLGFVLVFILAVILGGAIGGLFARENARLAAASSAAAVVTTVYSTASMYDASTIATPTGLASLPTYATYALPLGDPESRMNGCLPLEEQRNAWSCEINGPDLRLSLDQMPGKPHPGACITPMDPGDTTLRYGMQPPRFDAQRLVLVHDYDDPSKGPAYHFSARYDKIVVVEGNNFPGLEGIKKRDATSARESEFEVPQGFRGRRKVQVGDLPWLCVWNDTFIEGFIYVNEDTVAAASSSSAAAAASAAAISSSSYPTTMATSPQTTSISSPTPTSSGTVAAVTSAHAYSDYTQPFSGFPSARPAGFTAVSRPAMERRGGKLPSFPRVVKIEERRLTNNPDSPYCQQWRVLFNGDVVPMGDSDEKPIIVKLEEEDPLYPGASIVETRPATTGGASEAKRSLFGKRKDPYGACHCQWSST